MTIRERHRGRRVLPATGEEGGVQVDVYGSEIEQGPSWARDNWPLVQLDEVNAGLDPTLQSLAPVAKQARQAAAATGKSEAEVEQAALDSIRAMMLIRTYRV